MENKLFSENLKLKLKACPLQNSSPGLFIGQASLETCSDRASAGGASGREIWKPFQIMGETASSEPVTDVTGCDDLLVTGW